MTLIDVEGSILAAVLMILTFLGRMPGNRCAALLWRLLVGANGVDLKLYHSIHPVPTANGMPKWSLTSSTFTSGGDGAEPRRLAATPPARRVTNRIARSAQVVTHWRAPMR